jgi:hypothetical protein
MTDPLVCDTNFHTGDMNKGKFHKISMKPIKEYIQQRTLKLTFIK